MNTTKDVEKNRKRTRLLDMKLDEGTRHALMVVNIIMICSILIHDGDHVRQAFMWSYSIPVSLLVLNLVVYLPTAIAIFLTKTRRFSATLVTAFGGLNTAIAFAKVHLLGAASGLWGIWNEPYVDLGVDWLSWVILAEVVFIGIAVACAGMYYCGIVVEQSRKADASDQA